MNQQGKGFLTPPATWRNNRHVPVMPCSEKKPRRSPQGRADDLFHVIHKVPAGDSPYVRAKHVQLIDKDPSKAISLFWSAINSGDRVDSALKDMAVVMKQLDRSDEAIEAIKSFRHLCPAESQESLDNVLVELFKKSGRIEEEIEMLLLKLRHIEEGIAFGGKLTKMARSQGKKVNITIEKEYSRLLGNLAWAYVQQKDYKSAEGFYRKALSLEPDKNKQCNLAICLMHMNKITEARFLLRAIKLSADNKPMDESYAKSYERATEMMDEIESQSNLMNPLTQEKEIGKEVRTPVTNRNSTGLDQINPFGSVTSRSLSDGNMDRKLPIPKWNRGTYQGPSFCSRRDENWRISPVTGGGIPRVPYTQPRRTTSWSFNKGDQNKGWLPDRAIGDCSRKLLFEQPTNNNALQLVSEQHFLRKEINPPENEHPFPTGENGGLKDIAEHTMENLKSVQLNDANQTMTLDFSMFKSKKSWADMVDEDEQELQNGIDSFADTEEFNDENMNYNITPIPLNQPDGVVEKIEFSDLKGGYYTQPGTADSSLSRAVRRTLCFDKDQKLDRVDSYCLSPPQDKASSFDSHASMLSEGSNSSNGIKLLRRNRLQVFRDITPECPRP